MDANLASAGRGGSQKAPKRMVAYYELRQTLGKGMSGKVKLGLDTRTGEAVAVKIMYKDKMSARAQQQLQREITAMKATTHPNVLRLKDVYMQLPYTKKNGQQRDVVILVLELAAGGELFDFMMYTGAFPEAIARTYFRQMLSALEKCHTAGIAHRDIKPENLLLDSNFQLKVADFGLSSITEDENGVCYTECGTRSYMAPEVLARRPYDGSKADLWSAGVVLFIMLAGNPPFQMAASSDWWFKAVSTGRYDRFWMAHLRGCPDFPPGAQKLLNKIFVANPAQRASLHDLLQDPWLQGETRTSQQLYNELMSRKQTVDQRKEAERQAHLRKKLAQRGSGNIDPYRMMVERSVPGEEERIVAPALPEDGLLEFNVLYSVEPADTLLDRIAAALKALPGNTSVTPKKDAAKVKAAFSSGLELLVQVYANRPVASSPSKRGPEAAYHVIDVARRAGDMLEFVRTHQQLAEALSDIVSSAEDVSASPRDTFDLDDLDVSTTSTTGQERADFVSLPSGRKPFMGLLPPPTDEELEEVDSAAAQSNSNGHAQVAKAEEAELADSFSEIDVI